MDYATTPLWLGSGPSSGKPGLTVIHDAAAWDRVRTALGAEYAAKLAGVTPDWDASVLLFARSGATAPETRLRVARLTRSADVVTVEVALAVDSPSGMSLPTLVQPWLLAAAPRAAFAGAPEVRLVSSGAAASPDAVTHERTPDP
ncbi:MAG TPA: hypothetical protein VG389_07950 [Myxococcota bacterium]|jgi:S1-C subfamily serine protease|nr:hypothetical protein [Myxococcota bacterium]